MRRLTDDPAHDEGPIWSPDGTKIAFASERDGQEEVYVMDADGGNERRVTNDPARDESPDWQPVPFDLRGHKRCGDISLAAGGASSVVAHALSCTKARSLARRWTRAAAAHPSPPPTRLHGMTCRTARAAFDMRVVRCRPPRPRRADAAFVWRSAPHTRAAALDPPARR